MENDQMMLRRWLGTGDAEAFAALARRHQGMVYGTSLRILGDHHAAEDVAQECFLELARRADQVRNSVAGFLHALACSRARDRVRAEQARRRREATVRDSTGDAAGDPPWQELAPVIDAALAELPDEQRLPLILHFFEGRPQKDIAEELGCDQATVSRRLRRGIEELRRRLIRTGATLSLLALTRALEAHGVVTGPASLATATGRIAMAGPVPTAAMPAASSRGGRAATILAATVLIGVVVLLFHDDGRVVSASVPPSRSSTAVVPIATVPTTPFSGAPAVSTPDLARLSLRADHIAQDSFSLTIQAALRLYGRDIDYETVFALSGNGFAPGIHPPETCRQLQRLHGRGRNLDLIAAHLGLTVRDLELESHPEPWTVLAPALEAGDLIITSGGWLRASYTDWGIILEAGSATPGQRCGRGATVNGRTDNWLDHNRRTWAVRPVEPTLGAEAADRMLLVRAIARIRGDAAPFLPGEVVYGLEAMDRWIADMQRPAFQPDDPGSSAGNASLCALDTSVGAELVAAYLHRHLPSFPEAARPHLTTAASEYERIHRLLAPFAAEPGRITGYAGVIGDQSAQRRHALEVLLPCKEALARAAENLERALAVSD